MVDNIYVIKEGGVTEVGTYDELLSHDGDFSIFLKTYFLNGNDTFAFPCHPYYHALLQLGPLPKLTVLII